MIKLGESLWVMNQGVMSICQSNQEDFMADSGLRG